MLSTHKIVIEETQFSTTFIKESNMDKQLDQSVELSETEALEKGMEYMMLRSLRLDRENQKLRAENRMLRSQSCMASVAGKIKRALALGEYTTVKL